jgi:hypothetical protein
MAPQLLSAKSFDVSANTVGSSTNFSLWSTSGVMISTLPLRPNSELALISLIFESGDS